MGSWAKQVVPSDDAEVVVFVESANFVPSLPVRSIYVGTGGTLSVEMRSGTKVFSNVQDGSILPVRVTRINFAGTTTSDMVVMY